MMLDVVISLATGGAIFLGLRWLIYRKRFPYKISPADQLRLGSTITSLSDVMLAIEKAGPTSATDYAVGIDRLPLGDQPKATVDFENGLAHLTTFDPEIVTYVLLGSIRTSMGFGHQPRAIAQSKLLDRLVTYGIAIPSSRFA